MKSVTIAEAKSDLDAMLKAAQKERIVLTREGKPSAVLVGVESYDEEDLQLATSTEFWEMIEARRAGRSIPLAELKKRLKAKRPPKARTAGRRSPAPKRRNA